MPRVKKRADGRISLSFSYDGKRYWVYGRTKQDAEEKKQQKLTDLKNNAAKHKDPTLDDYYDSWKKDHCREVGHNTAHAEEYFFRGCADQRIAFADKTLGEIRLSKITTEHIRAVRECLVEKGLAPYTINQYIGHLSYVMKTAELERLIQFNPCKPIKPLKKELTRARDTVHRDLNAEELKRFLADARKNSWYYHLYRFALHTGMRIGEIGALQNKDIHDGCIHVCRTLTRDEVGHLVAGSTTKTKTSVRQIPVNKEILSILAAQRRANRDLFGNVVPMEGLIFRSPQGSLLRGTAVNRDIHAICKRQGIERFSFHAFRATFATLAANEWGFQPLTLKEILGHQDINMTLNLYARATDASKMQAMEQVAINV